MNRKIIAGNWKMHKTIGETVAFVQKLAPIAAKSAARVLIAPPFTAIAAAAAHRGSIEIGAQNMHEGDSGPFTGEISGAMLLEAGARFVILGHSERRNLFHETDSAIHRKVQKALALKLLPILCVGETLAEREAGRTKEVLERQLACCLGGITPTSLILAYEPVWAIGTGKTATPAMAQEAHQICRTFLSKHWEGRTPILYGGSVTPETAPALVQMPDIDGALVGGASLQIETFTALIQGVAP